MNVDASVAIAVQLPEQMLQPLFVGLRQLVHELDDGFAAGGRFLGQRGRRGGRVHRANERDGRIVVVGLGMVLLLLVAGRFVAHRCEIDCDRNECNKVGECGE